MAPVQVVWRDDIIEHVKYGRYRYEQNCNTGRMEWRLSGAHNSHGFLELVAEFTENHPETSVQLTNHRNTFFCGQDNDYPTTCALKYKVEGDGALRPKSLYNPRCFKEDKLKTLAEKAFRQSPRDAVLLSTGDTPGTTWNGNVTENGQRFVFGGYYEVIAENVFKITSFWLEAVRRPVP